MTGFGCVWHEAAGRVRGGGEVRGEECGEVRYPGSYEFNIEIAFGD